MTNSEIQLFYAELTLIDGLIITEGGYHYALYAVSDLSACDWEFIGPSDQSNQS